MTVDKKLLETVKRDPQLLTETAIKIIKNHFSSSPITEEILIAAITKETK
jgi:hypothetical protein